ncbi:MULTISPECIES: threonine/serine ThrE exporter family protein [Nocardiopsidaceae]|uniref:Threonine/serine exporter family protein n=2 Tax=Nocardiopsidaceae TaxID=83676 RepID=A0ABY6YGY5_9ACTN|nr:MULTISPECIES: threonine/serine exporter family protein [Nocardiopsaceae]MEE2055614.1 threonine/serine exporter family protein [Nocardiopsis umidischolae]WAE71542.1 threonine/serine exporter family protein [Streptomonospora nanhaiensis]
MPSKRERPVPPSEDRLLSRMRDWRAEHERELTPDGLDDNEAVNLPDARAMDLVLRVGELMLASGEGTEAVSESMLSLSVAFELPRSEVSVTFTTITLSTHPGGDQPPVTGERVVRRRSLDYFRVNELHTLVQQAALGLLELEDATARLSQIRRARMPYPNWVIVFGFGLIASSASVMMGGGLVVAAAAFLATVLGDRTAVFLARRGVAEFYQMAAAAVVAATIGVALLWVSTTLDLGLQAAAIITGNIMALLPGRPLVSSLQDGISGSYVSSAARLLETFFILGAIVSGVGAVAYTAIRLGVPVDLDSLPSAGTSLEVPVLIGAAGIAMAFAISLAVPPRMLPTIGALGVMIWVIYAGLRSLLDVPPVVGTMAGAVAVGVVGHWLARRTRRPVLPYLVPSIAPLLPGSILYRGLIEITQGTAVSGLLSVVEAVMVGLALGAGVNLGGELVRAFQRGGLAGAGMRSRPAARRTRGGY